MPTRYLISLGVVLGALTCAVFAIDSCHRKQGQQQEVQVADRKSTRLNSSHT